MSSAEDTYKPTTILLIDGVYVGLSRGVTQTNILITKNIQTKNTIFKKVHKQSTQMLEHMQEKQEFRKSTSTNDIKLY